MIIFNVSYHCADYTSCQFYSMRLPQLLYSTRTHLLSQTNIWQLRGKYGKQCTIEYWSIMVYIAWYGVISLRLSTLFSSFYTYSHSVCAFVIILDVSRTPVHVHFHHFPISVRSFIRKNMVIHSLNVYISFILALYFIVRLDCTTLLI